MFKVIYKFKDLKDNNHIYEVGDDFPRKGAKATDERIKELSSNLNKIGKPLIKKVEEAKVDLDIAEPIEEIKVEKKSKKKK